MNRAKEDVSELKDAHRRVGNLVAQVASATGPRRSGKLAGSVRSTRQAKRARVVAGGSAIPYAGPIHWGWPARGISARPFISEAAQDSESQWVPIYKRDVQAALDKVKGA